MASADDAVFLRDLRSVEDVGYIGELSGWEKRQKGARPPVIDEGGLMPAGAEEAADELESRTILCMAVGPDILQGIPDIPLNLGTPQNWYATANAVSDFKSRLAFGDQPRELVDADDGTMDMPDLSTSTRSRPA